MAIPIVTFSGRKKNSLHKAVSQPPLSPNFAETGESNPHLRVFVAHFDGTQNDYKDVPKEFQETLVANSFKSISKSKVLDNRYYSGVGTRTDGFMGFVESVFGLGCEDRAEQAYAELAEATLAWRQKDPLAQVHVHVVGFSRGSAIGLHFMNLVHERGVVAKGDYIEKTHFLESPGNVLMSAVLLDTVSTFQNDNLKLGLPPSAVSVLHLTAAGELRYLFPLQSLTDSGRPTEIAKATGVHLPGAEGEAPSIDEEKAVSITYRRLHQLMIPGAHSDIGGSYRDGGIRDVSSYLMKEFQISLGIPIVGGNPKPSFQHIQNSYGHDSRYIIDKIGPQRPYTKGTRREINDGEITNWDGKITETVSIKSHLRGMKLESKDVNQLDRANDLISIEQLGKEYKLSVRLAKADKGERGRIVFESTPPGVFGRHPSSRRFMFFGKPLMSAPTVGSIYSRLEAGEKAFTLAIRLEKAVPVFALEQKALGISEREIDIRGEFLDEWPGPIRDAIIVMNGESKTQTQAKIDTQMTMCLESVARELQKIDKNAVVSFHTSGGMHGQMIHVTYDNVGPVDARRSQAWRDAQTCAMRDRIKSLQAALSCLGTAVYNLDSSLNPYAICNCKIGPKDITDAEELRAPTLYGNISYEEESIWERMAKANNNEFIDREIERDHFTDKSSAPSPETGSGQRAVVEPVQWLPLNAPIRMDIPIKPPTLGHSLLDSIYRKPTVESTSKNATLTSKIDKRLRM